MGAADRGFSGRFVNIRSHSRFKAVTGKRKLKPRPPRLPSMGSGGDPAKYANAYLDERLWQLEKDMTVMLAGRRADNGKGFDHAYFPALVTCCGMLELFANLHGGDSKNNRRRDDRLERYRKFLPGNSYSADRLKVLYQFLRNSIAHHGIAAGVFKDKSGRRITWKLTADTRRPTIELIKENGKLRNDPFKPCSYTHRLHVRLGRYWRDIRQSVEASAGYRNVLNSDPESLKKFHRCINQIFPQQ